MLLTKLKFEIIETGHFFFNLNLIDRQTSWIITLYQISDITIVEFQMMFSVKYNTTTLKSGYLYGTFL